jgi:hypothetical protein
MIGCLPVPAFGATAGGFEGPYHQYHFTSQEKPPHPLRSLRELIQRQHPTLYGPSLGKSPNDGHTKFLISAPVPPGASLLAAGFFFSWLAGVPEVAFFLGEAEGAILPCLVYSDTVCSR